MRKPNRNDDDTPAEVDFRGGVRGKYAERYRTGVTTRELPPLDPIAFYETQSRLGHALWQAQALEAAVVAYLSLVDEMSIPTARQRALSLLEHGTSQVIDALRPASRPDDLLETLVLDRLQRFVSDRNWLVHRSRFDLESQLGSQQGRRDLAVRLEGLADEARYLTLYFIRVIETSLSQRGLSPAEIEARTQGVIEEWAAA